MSLTFAASVSATDIVVCDDTGTIIVCSCEDFGCEHLGKVVDRSFVDRVLTDGTQFATGSSRACTTTAVSWRRCL